jgi:hypothetical protein
VYAADMKKISLYIEEPIYKKLSKHATRKGLKTAQLLRIIWREWLEREEKR